MIVQTPDPVTGMEAILAATSTLTTLVGDVFKLMTANPLLTLFLGASLVTVGIGIFNAIKGAAKG